MFPNPYVRIGCVGGISCMLTAMIVILFGLHQIFAPFLALAMGYLLYDPGRVWMVVSGVLWSPFTKKAVIVLFRICMIYAGASLIFACLAILVGVPLEDRKLVIASLATFSILPFFGFVLVFGAIESTTEEYRNKVKEGKQEVPFPLIDRCGPVLLPWKTVLMPGETFRLPVEAGLDVLRGASCTLLALPMIILMMTNGIGIVLKKCSSTESVSAASGAFAGTCIGLMLWNLGCFGEGWLPLATGFAGFCCGPFIYKLHQCFCTPSVSVAKA